MYLKQLLANPFGIDLSSMARNADGFCVLPGKSIERNAMFRGADAIENDDFIVGTIDGGIYIADGELGAQEITVDSYWNVTGTDYDDTITATGDGVTVNAGKGNDFISNQSANALINADELTANLPQLHALGDLAFNADVEDGTDGNDTIYSDGADATIAAGGGDDLIVVNGNDNIIVSGDGNDSITINETVSNITFADLNTSLDSISFLQTIAEGSLTPTEDDDGVTLSSEQITLVFREKTLDDELLAYTVDNNGTSTGILELIANKGGDTRVKLRFWNYEYTQSDSNAEDVKLDNSIVLVNEGGGSEIITPNDTLAAIWTNGADGNPHLSARNIDATLFGGQAILVGNDLENVIRASKGGSTMWGGAGNDNDTMIGGNGADAFVYLKGNGDDVLENVDAGDSVYLLNSAVDDIANVNTDGRSITVNFKEGGSLQVNTADINFNFSDGTTRRVVGQDFDNAETFLFWAQENVSSDVENFNALSANSIVLSNDSASDTILTPINSENVISVGANVDSYYASARNIDASRFGGKSIMVGNELENVIKASGDNSALWGGVGNEDDTLIGGTGIDTLVYSGSNGNDVIENVGIDDMILVNIPISEFDTAYIDGISIDSLTLKFNTGGSLKINSSEDVTITFTDGSTWHAINRDNDDRKWMTK